MKYIDYRMIKGPKNDLGKFTKKSKPSQEKQKVKTFIAVMLAVSLTFVVTKVYFAGPAQMEYLAAKRQLEETIAKKTEEDNPKIAALEKQVKQADEDLDYCIEQASIMIKEAREGK